MSFLWHEEWHPPQVRHPLAYLMETLWFCNVFILKQQVLNYISLWNECVLSKRLRAKLNSFWSREPLYSLESRKKSSNQNMTIKLRCLTYCYSNFSAIQDLLLHSDLTWWYKEKIIKLMLWHWTSTHPWPNSHPKCTTKRLDFVWIVLAGSCDKTHGR